MGSNIFINYSLAGVHLAYRLFGVRLTNALIESTGGAIFTGGVNLRDLKRVQDRFNERKTGTIACYVVEGLRQVENKTLDSFCDFTIRSIQQMKSDTDSHFALKLTAYIATDLMEKLSKAQHTFATEILEVNYDVNDKKILSKNTLIENLAKHGITEYS